MPDKLKQQNTLVWLLRSFLICRVIAAFGAALPPLCHLVVKRYPSNR